MRPPACLASCPSLYRHGQFYQPHMKGLNNHVRTLPSPQPQRPAHRPAQAQAAPREISHIKDAVAQMREALRTDKITRTHRKAEWAHLLKPLQYELNSAKVGRAYRADPNGGTVPPFTDIAARIEVFDAYIAVMEKLLARFALASKELQYTPIQLAKRKNATAKGSHIPNNGEHWTDWIPAHIKEPIHEAFAALPTNPKPSAKFPSSAQSRPYSTPSSKPRCCKPPSKSTRPSSATKLSHPPPNDKPNSTASRRQSRLLRTLKRTNTSLPHGTQCWTVRDRTTSVHTPLHTNGGTVPPFTFPVNGAWAMPLTIRNLPNQGESK